MADRRALVNVAGTIQELPSGDTLVGAVIRPATQVSGSGQAWAKEAIINTGALATGYNDNPGGVGCDKQIILRQCCFMIADPAGSIGGTGNLQIQWYLGSATAQETTLITTTQIAAGQHDVVVTLGSPQTCTINSRLRAKITLGTTTVAGPCHVEFRGDVDVN